MNEDPTTREALALLARLLLEVASRHEPQVASVLRGDLPPSGLPPHTLARLLHAQAILFQLLNIAEENGGMARRRALEAERGRSQVPGTLHFVVAAAAAAGVSADALHALVRSLHVRPVITAHPTEAKRVTVLERLRRIYRLLLDYQSPRWTARERGGVEDSLRNEIEVLLLTGDLRLEKPQVAQEVFWGLHFFNETLFDVVPELLGKLEEAAAEHYPGVAFEAPPFFELGSWIGGDRDGNPFVTNAVTRGALGEYRLASLQRHRHKLVDLARSLSISERLLAIPEDFRDRLQLALAQSGAADQLTARNPGEPFRQFAMCMLERLDLTIACTERSEPVPVGRGYSSAEGLVEDLRAMEQALAAARAPALARALVRPIRRQVETFRFCTARLDLRENSTRTTEALQELWRLSAADPTAQPPAHDSPAWRTWLLAELERPLREPRDLGALASTAQETMVLFRLVREMRRVTDRDATGRRLSAFQLGARQGADAALAGRRGARRHRRLLPRARRVREPRRHPGRTRHRRPARRLDPRPLPADRAGRGGVAQVREPRHGRLPDCDAAGRDLRARARRIRAHVREPAAITGESALAERFPDFRARLAHRLPTVNQVNREQIELLRRFRAAPEGHEKEAFKAALLLSINCVAASCGLGTTG